MPAIIRNIYFLKTRFTTQAEVLVFRHIFTKLSTYVIFDSINQKLIHFQNGFVFYLESARERV